MDSDIQKRLSDVNRAWDRNAAKHSDWPADIRASYVARCETQRAQAIERVMADAR
jgi:hypothetical protein